MTRQLTCPHCRHGLVVADEAGEKVLSCPRCLKEIAFDAETPATGGEPVAVEWSDAAERTSRRCPQCSADVQPEWRYCPHCNAALAAVRKATPFATPPPVPSVHKEIHYGLASLGPGLILLAVLTFGGLVLMWSQAPKKSSWVPDADSVMALGIFAAAVAGAGIAIGVPRASSGGKVALGALGGVAIAAIGVLTVWGMLIALLKQCG